jgi:hypothetical protein
MKVLSGGILTLMVAALLAVVDVAQSGMQPGVRIGPPPPKHEFMAPRPHPGWIWIAGHWKWVPSHDKYVWVRGRWVAGRPGRTWVDGHWEHRSDGWIYIEGSWRRP